MIDTTDGSAEEIMDIGMPLVFGMGSYKRRLYITNATDFHTIDISSGIVSEGVSIADSGLTNIFGASFYGDSGAKINFFKKLQGDMGL